MSQEMETSMNPASEKSAALPMQWIEENAPRLQAGQVMTADRKRSLPLAGMEIKSRVLDSACDTEIIQRFENPYDAPLEAIYLFPLPGAAAIYAFELKVGERTVKGKVQERGQARQAYQQALDQGHRAALMEQERDDVFTLQVGNIPPKESLEIRIRFCQQLDYREEGLFELRLPMVVAPRYIPGQAKDGQNTGVGVESDSSVVPDASRITPPRLAPGFDPRVDLKLQVELLLAPGESLSQLACSQHLTQTSLSNNKILVTLAKDGEALNRDFVLRWQAAGAALRSRMNYLQGPAGVGYGLLQLSAPASAALLQSGRDVIFLLDRSGSMGDYKMASASQACALLLESMGPRDRYAVLAFDDQMEWLEAENIWQTADEAGRALGQRFLGKIDSRGGTELFEAIEQSLHKVRQRGENANNTPILVILTDGQVGDESRILKAIQQELGEAVVYTIGIDTAVNDSFLTRLARLGGGTSVSVTPGEKLAAALKQIAGEIGFPALWELETDLPEKTPDPLPDLYQGRSMSVFFKGALPAEPLLKAQGSKGEVKMYLKPEAVDFPALPLLWAKSRIQTLEDAYRLADSHQKQSLRQNILAISLEHQILCRFTAWLAVDTAETIQDANQRMQVVQPVEMPQSWPATAGAIPPPPPAPLMMPAAMAPPMPQARMSKMASRNMMAPGGALPGMFDNNLLDNELDDTFGDSGIQNFSATVQMDEALDLPDDQAPAYPSGGFRTGSLSPMAPPATEASAPEEAAPTSVFGKLKEWVSPPKKKGAPPKPAREGHGAAAHDSKQQGSKIPQDLQKQIRTFLLQLESLLKALTAKEPVDFPPLLASREALLQLLGHSDAADQLPALQRLLRQEAQRLLKALQAGSSEGLEPLIERCQQQLDLAQQESPSGDFWEATI